ncbi:MAG: DUF559 domain-containing protein [Croceibacterium sp.]
MARQSSKRTVVAARKLRRTMSLPEVLLWQKLRQADLKLRRQHPAGPYVLDFYCAAAKLGIEIDGIAHDMGDRPKRDVRRDVWLGSQGFEIVRIPASEVLNSAADVADAIVVLCRARGA